jgi:hypothetical protein
LTLDDFIAFIDGPAEGFDTLLPFPKESNDTNADACDHIPPGRSAFLLLDNEPSEEDDAVAVRWLFGVMGREPEGERVAAGVPEAVLPCWSSNEGWEEVMVGDAKFDAAGDGEKASSPNKSNRLFFLGACVVFVVVAVAIVGALWKSSKSVT